MKKFFIRNLINVIIFYCLIAVILIFAYQAIANKILSINIGDNLSSSADATAGSIENKLYTDYNNYKIELDSLYTANACESVEDKKTVVIDNLNKIFPGVTAKIAGTLEVRDNYLCYGINNVLYHDRNSTITDVTIDHNITFANFGKDYVTIDDSLNTQPANDAVIFKFEDIFISVDAKEYLEKYFKEEYNNMGVDAFAFVYSDGKILCQSNFAEDNSFYEYLRKNGNNTDEIISDMQEGKQGQYPGISFANKNNAYLTTRIITNDEINYNFYILEIFSYARASSGVNKVLVPLLATFMVILLVLTAALFISFIYINSKNNSLQAILKYQTDGYNYVFEVTGKGKILSYDKKLKEDIYNIENYKSISDLNIEEDYPDVVQAMQGFNKITIVFEQICSRSKKRCVIKCIVLKYFNHYFLIGYNATEEEERVNKMYKYAYIDAVTNLQNHLVFKGDIKEAIGLADNAPDSTFISLVLFKIKNLNSYLTFYGEGIKNKINKVFSEDVQGLINERVSFYFIDNGVFGFIVNNDKTFEETPALCTKITNFFGRPIEVDGNDLLLDLCFSVYNLDLNTYTNHDEEFIYHALERLLDKVTTSTLQNIEVYSLTTERYISTEDLLERDLIDAINNREFEMYLQPQYNTDDDRIGSFEMLIRWNNPRYFGQSPFHFIEVAEKNGLIIQIGRFINEETMRIAKLLEPYDIDLSVNVSPVQLLQAGFVNEFISIADKYEVNRKHICIEITESFLMENFNLMVEKLKVLRAKGFKIHLDDFGTGYSSLLYLKELPVDLIKIDKDFIKTVTSDDYSKNIVVKIIQLARGLNLGIIAEGVEDNKQVQFLVKNNCNILQGYVVSRPVSLDKATELLEDYNVNKTKSLMNEVFPQNKEKKKGK